jgi:hypothetical protein
VSLWKIETKLDESVAKLSMILTFSLLLLAFGLLVLSGLLGVLREMIERSDDVPIFADQAAEQRADCGEIRSQFAWQSRLHSRGPD